MPKWRVEGCGRGVGNARSSIYSLTLMWRIMEIYTCTWRAYIETVYFLVEGFLSLIEINRFPLLKEVILHIRGHHTHMYSCMHIHTKFRWHSTQYDVSCDIYSTYILDAILVARSYIIIHT